MTARVRVSIGVLPEPRLTVLDIAPCPGCGRCSDGNNDYVARSPRESEKVYYHKTCSCGWRGPAQPVGQ